MRNKKGYLLPMVIIFVVISLIIGLGILYLGGSEQITAIKRYNREKAFYIAEAGVNRAIAYKKTITGWHPESTQINFGGGTFQVSEQSSGDTTILISTGIYHGQQVKVSIISTSSGSGSGLFGQGIFANAQVYINGSSQISGYNQDLATGETKLVGSNKSVYIESTGIIYGNTSVATGGTIYIPAWRDPNDAIRGKREYNASPRTFPQITIPIQSIPYTVQGSSLLSGNYQISGGDFTMDDWPRVATMSAGDYRFKSLKLSRDAVLTINGNARIYVEGEFSVVGGSSIKVSGDQTKIQIYIGSNGTFKFDNSGLISSGSNNISTRVGIYVTSSVENAVNIVGDATVYGSIYAPNTTCTISNSGKLYGGAVANKISLTGNARVYYDYALTKTSPPGVPSTGTGITLTRWKKPDWSGRIQ
ncbi:MAG TPA: hypothetical protein P5065_05405 [Candidatus Ratteibacteria bacterium]|nr:hypothetical protein [bacterium]HPC29997.1 hypothetical protein [bacterium]HRS06459.1 hypothetical protein [Candidatus Ratteibacteria bacterium]HRV04748.1 hypothetical protein [Candidatus Ratteibacteria bacterium]